MSTVKIHFDGWIALPATLRSQLSLQTGDTLEVEQVEGGLMLRVSNGAAASMQEAAPEPSIQPAPAAADLPARRKPGRPKRVAPPDAPASIALPPKLRSGGRRKTPARDLEAAMPQP
jgi:AbrB family looped-hinge helix DNA binding protein